MESIKLKPSDMLDAIKASIQMQLELAAKGQKCAGLFIWSPPGLGKSNLVGASTAALSMAMADVRAGQFDPVDLRGLPYKNGDGRAHWAVPDFLPRDGSGVLFLDELSAAPLSVQAACYQLVLDRQLGEYHLPQGWAVVAAGNRRTDRAVAHVQSSALASRFTHLELIPDLEDWTKWALKAGLPFELVAFVRFRPELLHKFDPAEMDATGEHTFPCPRTLEFAGHIIARGLRPEIEGAMLAGTIGSGAAAELQGFLKVFRTLPNVDAVLMNPQGADVPTDPATLYALSGALARKATENNFDRVATYAGRLPDEFAVMTVNEAVRVSPAIQHTRPFSEWAANNSDVLL